MSLSQRLALSFSISSRAYTVRRSLTDIIRSIFRRNQAGSDATSVYNVNVKVSLWDDHPDWQNQLACSVDMMDEDRIDRESFFIEFVYPYIEETSAFIAFVGSDRRATTFLNRLLVQPENDTQTTPETVKTWLTGSSLLCILALSFLYFHKEVVDSDSNDQINQEMAQWSSKERSFTHAWMLFALKERDGSLWDRVTLSNRLEALIDEYKSKKDADTSLIFERGLALIRHDPQHASGTVKYDAVNKKWTIEESDDVPDAPWQSVASCIL